MLTHPVEIAFNPQSTVCGLAISNDGNSIAWFESNRSVNILEGRKNHHTISIDSDIKGIFFLGNDIIFADDDFGLRCVTIGGKTVWECEIPGGVSILNNCESFIAVIDNLGRLSTLNHQGTLIESFHQFESIIKILPYNSGVILALESGSVHYIDGQNSVWERPARGDVGESITTLGLTANNNLIIGREGYALVPGEEEALELEVWDVYHGTILYRNEIKNRLSVTCSDQTATYLGFDDGSIHQLTYRSDNTYLISEELFSTKYPIKTLNLASNNIIAGSWFYLNGMTKAGEFWVVEHQGIIQHSAYCRATEEFYFTGDDQNDYTDIEPIGCIKLSSQLIERDKSELTEWFELETKDETMSAEQIYSNDEKFRALLSSHEAQGTELLDNELSSIMSALAEDVDDTQHVTEHSIPDSDILLDDLMFSAKPTSQPVANAGQDSVYQCGEQSHCVIVLDSSKTTGDKSKIVSYSWTNDVGREVSNLPKFRAKLGRGKHRFELRVIDVDGNSTSDSVQVEVV
ncbi:MAG: hypothetical protein CMB29_02765 [Euryarchaeota archaeon]|nr:hypothetical protein [Euryarchaeota archaeon]